MNNVAKQVISDDSMILSVIKKRAFGFDVMSKPEFAGRQFIEMSIDVGIENLKVSSTNVNEYIVVVDRKSALSDSAKEQLEVDWSEFCISNYVRKTSAGSGDPKVASIDALNHSKQALYELCFAPTDKLVARFVEQNIENVSCNRITQPCNNRDQVADNKAKISSGDLTWADKDEYKELTTLTYEDQDTSFVADSPVTGVVVTLTTGMGTDISTDLLVKDTESGKFYLLGFSYCKSIKVGDVERDAKLHTIEIDAMHLPEAVKALIETKEAEGDL